VTQVLNHPHLSSRSSSYQKEARSPSTSSRDRPLASRPLPALGSPAAQRTHLQGITGIGAEATEAQMAHTAGVTADCRREQATEAGVVITRLAATCRRLLRPRHTEGAVSLPGAAAGAGAESEEAAIEETEAALGLEAKEDAGRGTGAGKGDHTTPAAAADRETGTRCERLALLEEAAFFRRTTCAVQRLVPGHPCSGRSPRRNHTES